MGVCRRVAVICEYNPFHHGHLHQINMLKSEYSDVVCVMSGNLVQRGDVAVADKYIRARAAVLSGANLVTELPAPYCCSSARDFARAGVFLAYASGADALAFGAEDEPKLINELAGLVGREEFLASLRERIIAGRNVSYPEALTALVREALGDYAAEACGKPNNILALEYLNALAEYPSVRPHIIKRDARFESSGEIRRLPEAEQMLARLPRESRAVFEAEAGRDFPRRSERLDTYIIGTLRRSEGLRGVYGATDDLVCKIVAAARTATGLNGLASACADRKYTASRVRRAAFAATLGFYTGIPALPPYTLLLAADKRGCELLRSRLDTGTEIITKPSHASRSKGAAAEAFAAAFTAERIIALSAPDGGEYALRAKTPFIKD